METSNKNRKKTKKTKNHKIIAVIDNQFNLIKKIGKGATSSVYLGYDIKSDSPIAHNHKLFAFKVLKKDKIGKSPSNDNNPFNIEYHYLSSLSDTSNIIHLIGKHSSSLMKKSNGKIEKISYLQLEYLSNGELFDYVYYPRKGLGENFSRLIFKKLLIGLEQIELNNIAHLDLKAENIMVDDNYNVKICDFGFAVENSNELNTFRGTPCYAGPELHLKVPYNGFMNDIFSMGVILFILVTGTMPFVAAKVNDPYYNLIIRGDYDTFWKRVRTNLSKEFIMLVNSIFAFVPYQRPSIYEILQSEWMMQGDFSEENYSLLRKEMAKRKKEIDIKKKGL